MASIWKAIFFSYFSEDLENRLCWSGKFPMVQCLVLRYGPAIYGRYNSIQKFDIYAFISGSYTDYKNGFPLIQILRIKAENLYSHGLWLWWHLTTVKRLLHLKRHGFCQKVKFGWRRRKQSADQKAFTFSKIDSNTKKNYKIGCLGHWRKQSVSHSTGNAFP